MDKQPATNDMNNGPAPTVQLSARLDWALMNRLRRYQRAGGRTQRQHLEAAISEYLDRHGG